ncbi:MAG: tyrosine-type recombinase/integrase, partial [Actinomycetia bacterium]|nr:tyrosine-type recombinase/integrase [Actinomycetes bacterium]
MRQEFDSTGTLASASRTIRDATTAFEESKGSDDQKAWAAAIVIDGLGALRLNDLSVNQCDEFLRDAAAGKYGRRPIGLAHLRKLRQFLVSVLRNEVRIGNLGRNVVELSQLPAIDANEGQRRALTRAELRALLDAAHGSRLIIIDLMGRNGLRPAEARGLLWSDIDLRRCELAVTGQLDRRGNRTSPKTATAARTIQLDTATVGRLKPWHDEQAELRTRAGTDWQDLDIVASTSRGTPVERHSLARYLRLLCRRVSR